jgi:hypothetical protein
MENRNTGYGLASVSSALFTTGKVFVVTATTGANYQDIIKLWAPDRAGVARNVTTITLALAECVAGRGDIVILAPDFTTAPTAAELAIMDTKGVRLYGAEQTSVAEFIVTRPTSALPATTDTDIFTISGLVLVESIIGIVTTVIQTQACNLKLRTEVGAVATDICADLNISADAVDSRMSITGTFANAMINTAAGVPVAPQATAIVMNGGAIQAVTSATNTGAIRWAVRYKALEHGARIVAA